MSIFGTILRQYCENVQIGFGANIRDKTITWKGKFSSPKDMHSGADNVSLILAITRCISDCVGLIISFSLFHTVKLQRRGLDREVALLICSGSSWWLTDLGHNKLPNVILQSTSKANVEEPPELVFLLEQESEVYHFTPTEKLKRPPVAFPKNRDSGLVEC
ncbi:hypothetical protein ACFE04_017584 [Oxalis oulophora]